MISSLYGGRLAEEIIYGEEMVTTGASNDIERATEIAKKMVTQWGLSTKLGPQLFADDENEMYMPGKSNNMSDETAKVIDAEIKDVLDRNYKRAEQILRDNIDVLHTMKDALMKYETIDAKQIDDLMARREVRQPADWDNNDKSDSNTPTGGSSVDVGKDDKPADDSEASKAT
jgi:cell division protease FtsH